ncbi:tetratricopeptide repeat protein [Saccharothrix syringae]|uniref:Tetratricopeptide repeat protein n=1 Tax=Saccharothrix syringae TaxID=103733 RepID=A0A5Q0GZD0_SACSY|nr:tetratricopeptide repeat protein [Saccharothrix syringae]QFZ18890.1 tetratricopeptide repeat protein [Saccharothrix syringae]
MSEAGVRQVGVATDFSTVLQSAGDMTVQFVEAARVPTMEEVPARADLGRLPVVTRAFVGRSAELELLRAAVSGPDRPVVGVRGLGGVGKSTLVARFAAADADRFSLVWWVTADSPAAIEAGMAELARALAPEAHRLPLEEQVRLGVRWLATHSGWLLVLDDLPGPDDLVSLLERVRTGTVVVTTRRGDAWPALTAAVDVDVLGPEAASDLLTGVVRAGAPGADLTGAERVCEEVGWLPLAIEQAGAYIARTRGTPADYLDLLARFPARMFTRTGEGGDSQRTVARVWRITLDLLADTPLAGALLRQLAWYAPDAIPRDLCAVAGDELDVPEALARLADHNMITLDGRAIGVHRLVQAVTRTPDPTDPHRRPDDIAAARDTAAAGLARAVLGHPPEAPASRAAFESVRAHARTLLDLTAPDTDTEDTVLLLNQLGLYLRDQGGTATAVAYLARAAHSGERLYGADARTTLIARNNLATAHAAAGDFGRAASLHERNAEERARALGPDHPDTLASRGNSALAHQLAGHAASAIPLHEQVLADHERVLGPDHPETLLVRGNLAGAHREVGDLRRAVELLEAVLADRERVSGPEHRDTLNARNNLAITYDDMGDLGRAIPLYEATLADLERLLGADHPNSLLLRNNLASAYESAGDLGRAIPLFESTLEDRERVLGADHPDTLMSRNNLAKAHRNAGDLDRAIRLYEAALRDFERVLGPDDQDTLIVRNNLANAYRCVGDLDRAIPLFESTLEDRERVLGADHPDTLLSRNDLANAYQNAGDLDRAIRLYESALEDFVRVLSPDHPYTLTLRNNLAAAYWFTGGLDQARREFDAVLTTRERLLGPDHPDSLLSKHNLARAHESLGDLDRAVALFAATVAAQERVLGADHHDTLRSRYRLAGALRAAGDVERATPLHEAVLGGCLRVLGPAHALTAMVRADLEEARGLDPVRAGGGISPLPRSARPPSG